MDGQLSVQSAKSDQGMFTVPLESGSANRVSAANIFSLGREQSVVKFGTEEKKSSHVRLGGG